MHMLVFFGGLLLRQRYIVLEDFGMLVLGLDYSLVGYYILGVGYRKYVHQFGDF